MPMRMLPDIASSMYAEHELDLCAQTAFVSEPELQSVHEGAGCMASCPLITGGKQMLWGKKKAGMTCRLGSFIVARSICALSLSLYRHINDLREHTLSFRTPLS